MRAFGSNDPLNQCPIVPDTRLSLLLTAASAQAFNWPSSDAQIVRISVGSTISGVTGPVFFDFASTGAALPTTGGVVSTLGSSGGIAVSVGQPRIYQRVADSTGFSLIAGSSFSVCMEFWHK
jgi:hypothetical protein